MMQSTLLKLWLVLIAASGIYSTAQAAIPIIIRPTSPPASALPVVRSVVPSSASVGANITLSGVNLGSVVSVDFGDQRTPVLSRNATTVVVRVPPGARSGRITVNTPTESAKSSSFFTVTPSPTVVEFFPRSAPVGSNVTISGTELDSARAVQFGRVAASVVSKLPNQIVVRVPVGAQSGPITVVTAGLRANSRDSFEVAATPRRPILTDFSPPSARAGAQITLFGSDLGNAREVHFGAVRTTSFVVVSAKAIKVTVPSGVAPGPVPLSVVTAIGTDQSDSDFVVVAPAPTVFSVAGRITNSAGVGLLGVRVTRTDSKGTASVLTNASGHYIFTDISTGTYTLKSQLAGVVFSPPLRSIIVARTDVTGVNFTGSTVVQKFRLAGRITDRGVGLSGVIVTRRRDGVVLDSATTDASGNYAFSNILADSYALSAAKSGYTFAPSSLPLSLIANRSDAHFVATSVVVAPSNDLFARARVLISSSGRATAVSSGATVEPGEPAHAGNTPNASIWFRWTAPANGIATFDTAGSNYDTVLAIYSGATISTLNAVTANDDADTATGSSRVAFNATAGKTYHIAVDGLFSGAANVVLNYRLATPNVTPTPAPTTAPPNDLFARAQILPAAGGRVTGNNINATREANEPSAHRDASVWYRWTAPNSGTATFSTAGSTFDTALAAYNGATVSSLRLIASNDDDNGIGTSQIIFSVRRGVVYQIAVGGYDKAQGAIVLSHTFRRAPANDDVGAAQAFSGPRGRISGSTIHATREDLEPAHAGDAARHSVWFRYTPASQGRIYFSTENTNFNPRLAAYYRGANGALVAVGLDNGSGFIEFAIQRGVTYYVAVDGHDDETGTFDLVWSSNFQLRVQLTSEKTTVEGINVYLNSDNYTDTATTNDDGVAVFNNVPTGRYSVMPESVPVFAAIASPASQSVNLTGEAFLSFAILGPYALSGRVVDEKGAGVADVNIEIRDGKYFVDNLYTDAAGYYTYPTLPPGSYSLTPTSPNSASIEPTAKSVNIERANITGINFVVYGPFTISGRLLDDKGAPVANRTVALNLGGQVLEDTLTDQAGNYAFVNTVAAGTYTVNVVPDDPNSTPEPSARTVGVERADVAGVDFLILGPFTISGRVLNENGAPVPSLAVALFNSQGTNIAVESSDANGFYNFQNAVAPGTYTVSITPPEGTTADPVSRTIVIARADVIDANFTIRPNPTGTNSAQSTSSVSLSSAAASVNGATVVLNFTGALNAQDTASANRFGVTINGRSIAIESALAGAGGRVVTLQLPKATFTAGAKVTVNWANLRDAKGRRLRDGSTLVMAR